MRGLAAAPPLIAAVVGTAAAAELGGVSNFDAGVAATFLTARSADVEALVADTTMLARFDDANTTLHNTLPFGDSAVLYFVPDGTVLAWPETSDVVQSGSWEVIEDGAENQFCILFGVFHEDSICLSAEDREGPYWLKQFTPGNPFGLVAGAPVPMPLGSGPVDLASLAGRLP